MQEKATSILSHSQNASKKVHMVVGPILCSSTMVNELGGTLEVWSPIDIVTLNT